MPLTRREFVHAVLAAGLLLPRAGVLKPQDSRPESRSTKKGLSLSLAQWSLHRMLHSGKLDPRDFAKFTTETFNLQAVEYVNTFYPADAADVYYRELRRRADDHGVRSLLIMCDGLGHLGDPDRTRRMAAVEKHRPLLAAAQILGCHSIRVNAYSSGSREEQGKLAADGLRRLAELADPMDLNVIVENHGGFSSDGRWIIDVMKRVDHRRIGTLPDFGNFKVSDEVTYDRYQGVEEMMLFARAVSAKSYDFDADGSETTINFSRMISLVRAAGYSGHIGIEYEGKRLDEVAGIRATQHLLEMCLKKG